MKGARTGGQGQKAPSKGPVTEIIVAVVIALLVGGTYPWWWSALFPGPPPIAPECSVDALKTQLRLAGPDKGSVITATARVMKEQFRLQHFDCVYGLAAVLLQDDPDNGHGLNYSGEVWRVRAAQDPSHAALSRDRMREHFFRYLSAEEDLHAERDGKGEACYRRAKGYCAERTAYLSHLMAVDYYQQVRDATDKATKIQKLERVDHFLEKDLAFGGFDQIISSTVLKGNVQQELQNENAQQAVPPGGSRPAGEPRR